ncbi:glycosyltransferase [Streptomyces sp. NPDC055036]
MRVLFTSTGGSGHFHPLVPFIDACAERGDEVLVVGPPKLEATLAARDQPYRIGGEPSAAEFEAVFTRAMNASPDEGRRIVNTEFFGRLCTAALLPAVEEVCREWRPDLVLREPCEYAGAVVAGRLGVPHAQVAISAAEIEEFALGVVAPVLAPYGERIVEQLWAAPYMTRFPASLDPSPFAVTQRFRELVEPAPAALPDWWNGSADPLVYLTLGTEAGGMPDAAAAYRATLDAVRGLPVRVLLTAGRTTDVSAFGPLPPNVHMERWVPQADVLGSASVVLCHGGSGTTFGALAAGVPLVIVPFFADQPANARLVTTAGAGLSVTPTGGPPDGRAVLGAEDVPRIRSAVETVLGDPAYRTAAERLAAETRALPPAAELLDALLLDTLTAVPAPGALDRS